MKKIKRVGIKVKKIFTLPSLHSHSPFHTLTLQSSSIFLHTHNNLSVSVTQHYLLLSRPDGFEETLFGGQTAKGVVSFRGETDGTSEGEGNGFTSETTFSIDFTNVQLDGSVILGGDQAVSSRATIVIVRV